MSYLPVKHGCSLSDTSVILNCVNKHLVSSGSFFFFKSLHPDSIKPQDEQIVCLSPSSINPLVQTFNLVLLDVIEVHRALKHLDPAKSAGPDKLAPFFLKSAADFTARPLTHIFNLTFSTTTRFQAFGNLPMFLPLLKGGDPTVVNNYRAVSKLCVLAKVLEKFVQVNFWTQ